LSGVRKTVAVVAVVVGLVLLGGTTTALLTRPAPAVYADGGGGGVTGSAAAGTASPGAGDPLTVAIAKAQRTLQTSPSDWQTWAVLGAAYVEQARLSADPSYYPKSEGALSTSLVLHPEDNFQALTGMGALANARHEFTKAADYVRRSEVINPASPGTFGVLTDALVQLGDYGGATAAVQTMLNLDPGVSSLTRASYDRELHGLTDAAAALLQRALMSTSTAGDIVFCRTYLGQLAFTTGNLTDAASQYGAGLAAVPGDPGLLYGQAQVDAARGNTDAAIAGYQQVVNVRPLPQYLVEYGELLESLGRATAAQTQYTLFATSQKLFAANGVQDNLTAALLDANRGDASGAVRNGEAEWAARHNIDAADALGWALHSAGRNAEALPYAQQATALGTKNASFLYHRGVIEAAVGQPAQARSTLSAALATNPHFSPLYAPRAQAALARLGGPV